MVSRIQVARAQKFKSKFGSRRPLEVHEETEEFAGLALSKRSILATSALAIV
jgi:hypothetical protein